MLTVIILVAVLLLLGAAMGITFFKGFKQADCFEKPGDFDTMGSRVSQTSMSSHNFQGDATVNLLAMFRDRSGSSATNAGTLSFRDRSN